MRVSEQYGHTHTASLFFCLKRGIFEVKYILLNWRVIQKTALSNKKGAFMQGGKYLRRDYPLLRDVKVDLRLIGFPPVLNPFSANTTAARSDMLSSHIPQDMVVEGSEPCSIFTGFEKNFGEYEFNTSRRDEDVEVIEILGRYSDLNMGLGSGRRQSPMLLVIYRGLTTGEISYFKVERYFRGSDDFGHENVWNNMSWMKKGAHIPKDATLVTSPRHQGSDYCYTTEANVAMYTAFEGNEDAFVLSESFAKKGTTTQLSQVVINVRQDAIPTNIHGDEFEYKFLPDLNGVVGDDGVLCAFRPVHPNTFAADTAPGTLNKIRASTDIIYNVPPGSVVVDYDFWGNKQYDPVLYGQIMPYRESMIKYWSDVVDVFRKLDRTGAKFSATFTTYVSDCVNALIGMGCRVPEFPGRIKFDLDGVGKQPVEFLQIVVTYKVQRTVQPGFKLTDRHGCKGVVCAIVPDRHMPIDQNGIRADMCMSPSAPVARMIAGPIFEPDINRISEFVRRKMEAVFPTDPEHAYEIMIDWYHDVHPAYAELTNRTYTTPESRKKMMLTQIKKGVRLWIPPFLKTITRQNIDKWTRKHGAHATPITCIQNVKDDNGQLIEKGYTTFKPVSIGKKSIMWLCKIPHATSPGVARVAHQGYAIRPGRDAKYASSVGMTPVKFGEDENRNAIMLTPAEEVTRLNRLQGNALTAGVNRVTQGILRSPHPTQILRFDATNEELAMKDSVLGMFHHTTSVIGIETRYTLTNKLPPTDPRLGDGDILEDASDADTEFEGSLKHANDFPEIVKKKRIIKHVVTSHETPNDVTEPDGSEDDDS